MGLLFLKPSDVEDCYFLELYAIKPEDDRLEKFSDYLLEMYLTDNSKFPPHIWADASAALNKTTNACESFHSHFNSSIYNTHPSIFVFLDAILGVQAETYIKCNSVNINHKYKTAACKKKQDFIIKKIEEYERNALSRLEYVKILSYFNNYV